MANIKDYCPLWDEWYADESSQIGRGTFGRVYRAVKRDRFGEYEAAVKHIQIPPEGFSDEDFINEGIVPSEASLHTYYKELRDKLVNEINICYSLKGNSNIVSFEEHQVLKKADKLGYDVFIRMEYLETLTQYINREKCDEKMVVKIGLDICDALILLGKHNIIHRDIKPANIFVNKDGTFKLGDFGESRILMEHSASMSVRGTFHYMAPEVLKEEHVGCAADIYSLGLVMYRLLNNNKYPFINKDVKVITSDMLDESNQKRFSGQKLPPPCDCTNKNLAEIILKACEYNPADRWRTPKAFKQALLAYINGTYNAYEDRTKTVNRKPPVNIEGDTIGRGFVPPQNREFPPRDNFADNYGKQLTDNNGMNPYSDTGAGNQSNQQANKAKTGNAILIAIISVLVTIMVAIIVVLAVPAFREAVFDVLSLSDSDKDNSDDTKKSKASDDKKEGENATSVEKAEATTEQTQPTQPPTAQASTKVVIPSYANKTYNDAKTELEKMGLVVRAEYEHSDTIPKNSIIRQDYSAGTTVEAGTVITFTVSEGPNVCPYEYSQFVQVVGSKNSTDATLTVYNWVAGEWVTQFTCDAKVGKNGIGYNYGEGKSITPQGIFKLGVVLSANIPNTTMPYYKVTSNTCIVDDSSSYLYNTICDITSLPSGTDYDPIGSTITKGTVSECIYIEHNGNGYTSDNVVRGKGSVITICGWAGTLKETYGCVDISSENMKVLLSLLDVSKNPHIDITTN